MKFRPNQLLVLRQPRFFLPLLLLLIWAAANYGWWRHEAVVMPVVEDAQSIPLPQAVSQLAGLGWFGQSQSSTLPAPTVRLLGLLGGERGRPQDFVVLEEDGQNRVLRLGQMTAGGWQLQQILADSIVLIKDGQSQGIALARGMTQGGGQGDNALAAPAMANAGGLPARGGQVASQPPAALPPAAQLQE